MLSQSRKKSKIKLESCLSDSREPKSCTEIHAIRLINIGADPTVGTHALPAKTKVLKFWLHKADK